MIASTAENLQAAIDGETYEFTEDVSADGGTGPGGWA